MANATNAADQLYAVCEPFGDTRSGGILQGNPPTKSTLVLALVHIILANIFKSVFDVLISHIGQVSYIPNLLSGIVIGPSLLSHNENFKEKFFGPERGNLTLNALERIALVFIFFLLHMFVDLSLLKRPGKLAIIIGLATFLLPIFITLPVSFFLKPYVQNEDLKQTLPFIGFILTSSQFRQIVILLEDLKLLSSELGRTATVSALISWCFGFVLLLVVFLPLGYGDQTVKHGILYTHLSHLLMIVVIVFVFRPLLLWMMRRTPERRSLNESDMCIIIIMVLVCSIFGESTGHSSVYGPTILGIATPNNPPMGSSLLQRLGVFVWTIFMPSCAINIGKLVNIFDVGLEHFLVVNFVYIIATLGKLLGAIIPSLYFNMPLKDALSLGIVLCARGFFDILYVYRVHESKVISEETFSTLIFSIIFQSLVIGPVFKAIYDTSRRYMAYNRRTIQHIKQQSELQIVVCIHELDTVISVLNILEIFNPTRESPFNLYVLNQEDLFGCLMPSFISHKYHGISQGKTTRAGSIIKHFDQFKQQRQRLVEFECFTSVSPYATMHNDICALANDKNTSVVIVPCGNGNYINAYVRSVSRKVLENAPCSVVIFFGRGIITEPRFLHSDFLINACVIFVGGADDREALALGLRMVENPFVTLTVVRIIQVSQISVDDMSIRNRIQDEDAINHFKRITFKKRQIDHVAYKEEKLCEVSDTARVLQSMEDEFDLMVVGRRHDNCQLLEGFSPWTEMEELGVIGDLILSWDAGKTSLLVVQQQASVIHEMLDKPIKRL